MSRSLRVYLSGPITKGDRTENFRAFCLWQKVLMDKGFAVLNPGLSMLHPDAWTIAHEAWLQSDLPWIRVSDVVIRIPGESAGADREVEHAEEFGVPVFFSSSCPFGGIGDASDFLDWVRRDKDLGKMPKGQEAPAKDGAKTRGSKEAPRSFVYHDAHDVCEPEICKAVDRFVAEVRAESSILDEAKAAVTGDRQASYGPPDQDFARTAGMWSALFGDLLRDGVRFEPFHVAQAMILLKMSRQRHQRKRDNWVDAAGYAHCGAICDEVTKAS